jgi:hypothetical protein
MNIHSEHSLLQSKIDTFKNSVNTILQQMINTGHYISTLSVFPLPEPSPTFAATETFSILSAFLPITPSEPMQIPDENYNKKYITDSHAVVGQYDQRISNAKNLVQDSYNKIREMLELYNDETTFFSTASDQIDNYLCQAIETYEVFTRFIGFVGTGVLFKNISDTFVSSLSGINVTPITNIPQTQLCLDYESAIEILNAVPTGVAFNSTHESDIGKMNALLSILGKTLVTQDLAGANLVKGTYYTSLRFDNNKITTTNIQESRQVADLISQHHFNSKVNLNDFVNSNHIQINSSINALQFLELKAFELTQIRPKYDEYKRLIRNVIEVLSTCAATFTQKDKTREITKKQADSGFFINQGRSDVHNAIMIANFYKNKFNADVASGAATLGDVRAYNEQAISEMVKKNKYCALNRALRITFCSYLGTGPGGCTGAPDYYAE